MGSNEGLNVRRVHRHEVSLPGSVRVAEEHSTLLRFTSSAGVTDGWLPVDVVDLSAGGVGFVSRVFIPRMARLDVRVGGLEGEETLLECRVRVQRVVMTDRRPAYLVGGAFDGMTDEQAERASELLARLEGLGKEADGA